MTEGLALDTEDLGGFGLNWALRPGIDLGDSMPESTLCGCWVGPCLPLCLRPPRGAFGCPAWSLDGLMGLWKSAVSWVGKEPVTSDSSLDSCNKSCVSGVKICYFLSRCREGLLKKTIFKCNDTLHFFLSCRSIT